MSKEELKKKVQVSKEVLNDRVVSDAKDEVSSATAAAVIGGAGTLYGIKKELGQQVWSQLDEKSKRDILTQVLKNKTIPIAATTTLAGSVAVPLYRLNKLHKEEFGSSPDTKDYARLMAMKGIPNSLYYGAVMKNKNAIVDNGAKLIMNAPKLVQKGVDKEVKKSILKDAKNVGQAGATVQALDELAGVTQLLETPETIIKRKKKRGSVPIMQSKEAFEIVNDGFEKMASGNLLKNIGGVLSGSNVRKAKQGLEASKKIVGNVGTAANIATASGNSALRQKDRLLAEITEAAKKQGLRLGKDGGPLSTKLNGLSQEDLMDLKKTVEKSVAQSGKAKSMTDKELKNIAQKYKTQNLPTKSENRSIAGVVDNIKNRKVYKDNQLKNEQAKKIVDAVRGGKPLDPKELAQHKYNIIGQKKSINNPELDAEVAKINEYIKSKTKMSNQMNKNRANLQDINQELKSMNLDPELQKKIRNYQGINNAQDRLKGARQVADEVSMFMNDAGLSAPKVTDVQNVAKSKYNKELAKTVGAYGAIGGGAAAGVNAINKKKKQETINPGDFRPMYVNADEVADGIWKEAGIGKVLTGKNISKVKNQIKATEVATSLGNIANSVDYIRKPGGATKGLGTLLFRGAGIDAVGKAVKKDRKKALTKELAKTVGAYGAIGGGTALGAKAIADKVKKDKK